jgi:hypothetical protein
MTTTHFILSTVCIGLANVCVDWLFIGFLFHRSQKLTPQTWRTESSRSYFYSTLLSLLFGVFFTFFYLKIGSKYVIAGNIWSHLKLGVVCFGCFSFIPEAGNAIYINYAKKFVLGKMIASAINYMSAACIASLFFWR